MGLKFQKGDWVAIAMVAVLAVFVAVLLLPRASQPAAKVEIYHQGQLVKTLSLDRDDSFTFVGKYTNVITVQDGKVSVSHSDCPGEDCVHSGKISAAGRSLVCLPNGVEVRIVGKADDVDFVVG